VAPSQRRIACQARTLICVRKVVISLAGAAWSSRLPKTDSLRLDLAAGQRRENARWSETREVHANHTEASGADLIYGMRRFVAPRTVESTFAKEAQDDRGRQRFLDLGSRTAITKCPACRGQSP